MRKYIMSYQLFNENHQEDLQTSFSEWKEKQKARGFPITAGDHQIPEKVVKSEIDANFQDVMKSI
jgi:hypothetical protein